MPITETTGTLIGAGASLLGTGINAASQGGMNKKNREWQEKRYGVQRADALADWNMQNTYNSPESQMARLKAAGLNPNLVYGHGADATSNQAVRSTDTGAYHGEAPKIDLQPIGDAMGKYYNLKIQKQTLSNMEAQQQVSIQEALNKAAQTSSLGITTARNTLDLQTASKLQQNTLDMAAGGLRKLTADTDYTVSQNERAGKLNTMEIQKGVTEMLNLAQQRAQSSAETERIKQATQILQKEGILKDWEIQLSKRGLTPHDGTTTRLINDNISAIVEAAKRIPTPKEFAKWVDGHISDFMKNLADKLPNKMAFPK